MRFPWVRLLALPALLLTSGCYAFDSILCWVNNGELREEPIFGGQGTVRCLPRPETGHGDLPVPPPPPYEPLDGRGAAVDLLAPDLVTVRRGTQAVVLATIVRHDWPDGALAPDRYRNLVLDHEGRWGLLSPPQEVIRMPEPTPSLLPVHLDVRAPYPVEPGDYPVFLRVCNARFSPESGWHHQPCSPRPEVATFRGPEGDTTRMMVTAYRAITVRVLPGPDDLSGVGTGFRLVPHADEVTVPVGGRVFTGVRIEFSAGARGDPANAATPPRDTVALWIRNPRRGALLTPHRTRFAADHDLLHTTVEVEGHEVGDYPVRVGGIINRPSGGGMGGTNYVEREILVRVVPRDRQHPGFEGLVLPDSLPEGGAEAEPAGGAALVDPAEARRRAMFYPGGGHFHAGEPLRGALLLGGAVGAVGLGAALSGGEEYDHEAHEYRSNRLPLLLGAAAAAGIWAYGVMDAASSAERVNERNGFAVGPVRVRPEPVLGVTPDGSPVVGLQLRVQR
jgi:hypothetical protein